MIKSRLLSGTCIGFSFGVMLASSFQSYHQWWAALVAGIFCLAGMLTADFSGPRDPKPAEEEYCPVCGYYCVGKGGMGCIDKPFLAAHQKPSEMKP